MKLPVRYEELTESLFDADQRFVTKIGCTARDADESKAIGTQICDALNSTRWVPIESAPKDGSVILVLSAAYDADMGPNGIFHHPPKAALARWNPEGTSWVSTGLIADNETCELQKTGIWLSGGGWFQPDEVTHWAPIPEYTPEPCEREEI